MATRWDGRLKSVDRFMKTVQVTPVVELLLQKSGVDLSYMKEVRARDEGVTC